MKSEIEKEKKRVEHRKKFEVTKQNSAIFFKECSQRLESINANDNQPHAHSQPHPVTKSFLGHFFSNKLSGIRKVFNDVMGSKMEKIPKSKFYEFVKKILGGQKLTEADIKDLFNYYCKRNKKNEAFNAKSVRNNIYLLKFYNLYIIFSFK